MTDIGPNDDLTAFAGIKDSWVVDLRRPWTLEELSDPAADIRGSSAVTSLLLDAPDKFTAMRDAEAAQPGWSAVGARSRAAMARDHLAWVLGA